LSPLTVAETPLGDLWRAPLNTTNQLDLNQFNYHYSEMENRPMAETSIEWTDATWNPVAGCTILTAGCTNCYAMRMAARLDAMGQEKYAGLTRKSGGRAKWTGKITLDWKALDIPAKWSRPRFVFVNSMSDLFHTDVPVDFIAAVWKTMEATARHTFQILTKRPDRMAEVLSGQNFKALPNVWLGTSVEDGRVAAV
jgi:protein gp37